LRWGAPVWNDDDPADAQRIVDNIGALMGDVQAHAAHRAELSADDVRSWHCTIYGGCNVPSTSFVGHFRGDPVHPDLVGYEVDVDGHYGTMSADVAEEVEQFFASVGEALRMLDEFIPLGRVPTTTAEIEEVVAVAAQMHGEWIRIHPFANGNGRTARLLAAYVALRYGLPVFATLKPRPADTAYAEAAKASMASSPEFDEDHSKTLSYFLHQLALLAVRFHDERDKGGD
jgi:fido (protein-threonine AMPylation protein)